ncbi:MAG TPA: hypothetical protein PLD88_13710, partial [Candidatus Berkiella sp.]|nr:hypothetical protein [Candidatus Berkiella sp.]
MAFNERHWQILQEVTDSKWHSFTGDNNFIYSDVMGYQDAMALKDGFNLTAQAQLLPINNRPGYFRVAANSQNLAQLIDNNQAFFLPNLNEKIANATSVDEIIRVIRQYPAQMLSSDSSGRQPLDKEQQIAAIRNLQKPNPNFLGKVTSNYGLEQKVRYLIQQENQLKMQAQMQPQVQ